ncbi:MAG: nucleotidyltransferase domain-containing protein [Myxococcota bacterium]|nr:nucleotidyltransferase domain-containing protein [Myxococcota bacterium]
MNDYVAALEALGVPVSRVVLFGSWARGQANEWSDIDVVVISPIFDAPNSRSLSALLWKALICVGGYLEPVPCGERRWIEDDESPIIEIARREGVEVYRAA